jgi:hypothetical protein
MPNIISSRNTLKINSRIQNSKAKNLNNLPLNNAKFINITKKKKNKPKTIKQYCDIYKKDIIGKTNLPLFNSCKINQYCRKYKCKGIDNKFKKIQSKTLGNNYNTLLMSSVYSKCPSTISDKNRKRCYNTAIKKFYKDNNLDEVYDKVIECDKKTCAKEKQIFYSNLFRTRKNQKQIKQKLPKLLNIEDLPDNEMIAIN